VAVCYVDLVEGEDLQQQSVCVVEDQSLSDKKSVMQELRKYFKVAQFRAGSKRAWRMA
jgi:hypothetical protein